MNFIYTSHRFIVAVALLAVTPAFAKGPTVKLTVSGLGMAPVELTDPAVTAVNVWSGNFIDWDVGSIAAPPSSVVRYRVQFHVKPPRSGIKPMYVVYVAPDPKGQRTLVYIPGRGEEWYELNVTTIVRPGQQGKWYYAAEPWGQAMQKALRANKGNSSSHSRMDH